MNRDIIISDKQDIFEFETNNKSVMILFILTILTNIFGMINLPTIYGFKIHTFQYTIFITAILYGPIGGAFSGGVGSMFSAFALNNPYIIIGNMILGLMTGLFIRRGTKIIPAVLFAYLIQIPWLYLTDVYLIKMPPKLVFKIIITLFITNMLWSLLTKYTSKYFKRIFL